MIIVNTTFVLNDDIAAEAMLWIKNSYLKSAEIRGASERAPMLAKVYSTDSPECTTYALHIYFPDMDTARKWDDGYGAGLRRVLAQKWGDKALAFHTFLEEI